MQHFANHPAPATQYPSRIFRPVIKSKRCAIVMPPVFEDINPNNPEYQVLAVATLESKSMLHKLMLRYEPDAEQFTVVASHPKGCSYKANYPKHQEADAKKDFTSHLEAEILQQKLLETQSDLPEPRKKSLKELNIDELEQEILRLEGEIEQAEHMHETGEVEDVADNRAYIANKEAQITKFKEALEKKMMERESISVEEGTEKVVLAKAPSEAPDEYEPKETISVDF